MVARIQIKFKDLYIVIDVDFLLITADIQTLLSMRYIVENGLDISIKSKTISNGERRQKKNFQNFFHIIFSIVDTASNPTPRLIP